MRGAGRALAIGLGMLLAAAALAAEAPRGLPAEAPREDTSTPPDLPLALVLDDGSREGAFGIGGPETRPFLWLNQLTRPAGVAAISLEEIWVLFPPEVEMEEGDPVQLVVYLDPDGDPTNGAALLAAYDVGVEVLDGVKFSTYPLPEPLTILGAGDILIGVVSRFAVAGPGTFSVSPAAIDTATSNQRSWIALWTREPPPLPQLPPDLSLRRLNLTTPGTFMIRGYGRPLEIEEVLEIPALGPAGLLILALLVGLSALSALRHR